MDSRKVPALLALVGVVVAVGLFLVLKDDTADEDSTVPVTTRAGEAGNQEDGGKPDRPPDPPKPEVTTIEVKEGTVVGGVQELELSSGETARLEVRTDAADELHLHGYDRYFDIKPGDPNEITFDADIEGLFELESHTTGELLAEISVVPN